MGKAYHRMSLISSTLDDTEFAPGLSTRQRAEVVKVCSRAPYVIIDASQ